jgi:hypothetical protein
VTVAGDATERKAGGTYEHAQVDVAERWETVLRDAAYVQNVSIGIEIDAERPHSH